MRFHEIVVIDDSLSNLRLLSDILLEAGYNVMEFDNGPEAIQHITNSRPNIILLDIMMPNMDGFEVCRALKANHLTSNIPIIFISALEDIDTKVNGFREGGVDYITKPFRREEVLARVQTHLLIHSLQSELIEKNNLLHKEIEHRSKTEKFLKASEEQFRNLFNNSPVGKTITRLNGTFTVNKHFSEMLGYSIDELNNKSWMEVTHPDDIELGKEHVQELLTGKTNIAHFEKRYLHKNGHEVWTEISVVLQRDQDGNPLYFITGNNDITQKKEAERILAERESWLQLSLKTNYASVFENNFDTGKVITTPELYRYLGYADDEIPKNIDELVNIIHPDDLSLVLKASNDHLAGLTNEYFAEFRIRNKAGKWIWIDGRGKIYQYNNEGKPSVLLGISRVIHDQKLAEEALQKSEFFFRESQKAALIGSYRLNFGTGEWESSEVLDQLFGIDLTFTRNIVNWVRIIHPSDREMMSQYLQQEVIEKHQRFNKEYRIMRQNDGAIRWMHGLGSLLFDENGQLQFMTGTIMDITDRKNAELASNEAKQKLDLFFNQSRDGFFFMEIDEPIDWNGGSNRNQLVEKALIDLRITRVNEALYSQYLAEPDFFIGKNLKELFIYNLDKIREQCFDLFDVGNLNMLNTFHKQNGNRITVEGSYTCQYNDEGKITGLFGIHRDVTENRKFTQLIQNERQLLRTLIDNLPYAIYFKDVNAKKMVANAADIHLMHCQTEADYLDKTDLEIFQNADEQEGYSEDMKVLESGIPMINKENTYIDADGNEKSRLISKYPIRDQNGTITGLVGIGHDITEQKKANATILKLSKSIEQSSSTILITDTEGVIEYVNPKFTEVSGYTPDEVIGKKPNILKTELTPPETFQQLWSTILSGEIWRGELLNRKKNGDLHWEWTSISPLKNEKGIITNFIATNEDISARKKMEADLILAKEKAEENDQLKSAFLANMSHEIRTPLNCILGFSELLSDNELDPLQRQEFVDLIMNSGNNLLGIINDILDISKIEAGQVSVRMSNFPIQHVIREVWKEFEMKAQEKNIQLTISPACKNIETFITNDEPKIKQVLINFVSNALKFTHKGIIEMGLDVDEDQIKVYVKDTGIGVPKAYHQQIFERFRQVETASTRKHGGNGLGLAISKSLIEMLGGTIGMESEPGKGSVFYFTIPRKGNNHNINDEQQE
ncbi:MAG: PAS domain S-box protein [Prolixibacteraceae bacterium]|nr:PAS domain S-box protein [Prolixibacteraceae bacterium]